MKRIYITTFVLFAAGAASAESLTYTFQNSGNISGANYTAPDANDFGPGITIGDFTIAGTQPTFGNIGGGIVDLTSIDFITSYRQTNQVSGNTTITWDFATTVASEPDTNVAGNSWVHNGGVDYQDDATVDYTGDTAYDNSIVLSDLTNLTNTAVTFSWVMDGSKNNTYARVAYGIDDIILTGTVAPVPEPSSFALLAGCLGLASVTLRRRR